MESRFTTAFVVAVCSVFLLAPSAGAGWESLTSTDEFNDTTIHTLVTTTPIMNQYGQVTEGWLALNCFTEQGGIQGLQVAIYFGGHFMSDYRHGTVRYRVDKRDAKSDRFSESNNNEKLFVRNERALAFMEDLLKGSELLVQATPYSESPVKMRFDISGIDERILPIADGCNVPSLASEIRARLEQERKQEQQEAYATCYNQRKKEGFQEQDAVSFCRRLADDE